MFENYRKTLPALFVSGFVAAAGSAGVATAQDSSPYLIGHWKLDDRFSDFKPLVRQYRLATPSSSSSIQPTSSSRWNTPFLVLLPTASPFAAVIATRFLQMGVSAIPC